MHFHHDPNQDFYYYGEEEPHGRTYKELLVESSPKLIGVDVETISLKERTAIGVGIAITPKSGFYFPLFPNPSPVVPWHLLKDPTVTKVFHNAIFDLSTLREYDIDNHNILDTMVMSKLLCYKYSGLMDLSVVHKMEVHEMKEVLTEYGASTSLDVPQPVMAKKCMQDAMACLKLDYELYEDVNKDYFSIEMQVIPILIEMSYKGLLLDQERRQSVEESLTEQAEYYRNLCEEMGFNPGSPQQVAYILASREAYNVFTRLPFTRNKYGRKTGNLSTSVETLKKMEDPIVPVILEYRTYTKLLSTYIRPWAHEDRAFTRFHLDAVTGRPSSTDRNMQNIPGGYRKDGTPYPCDCRSVLLPDSGVWTDMDWQQLEPRVLAYLSGDKEMQHIFSLPKRHPDGSKNEEADIHLQVAVFMNVTRKLGKTINLAMTYGATDETLMEHLNIRNPHRVRQLREMWGKKFPEALDWIDSRQEDALRTRVARTIFGRNIRLPDEEEESADQIKKKAIDYPCQGSAAEILKRGLILLKDKPLALQVHDEILVDGYIPEHVFEPLQDIAMFRTPVDIKYLERWE